MMIEDHGVIFCFFLLWVVFWCVVMAVGFESLPLVSEDKKTAYVGFDKL